MQERTTHQEFKFVGPNKYLLGTMLYEKQNSQKIYQSSPGFLIRQISLDKVNAPLRNQIKMTQSLNHPNIMKIFDVFQQNENLYILKERCDGMIPMNLQQEKYDDYMKQLFTAFFYLQQLKIVHRNIKLGTIYTHDGILKLKGFDYSYLMNDQTERLTDDPHPDSKDFEYRSPQMLKGQPYGLKSDIWSLGIVLFEIFYGKKPWKGDTIQQYLQNIQKIPLKLPYQFKLSPILKQMLIVNQSDRCQWEILFQSVGIYADDADPTEKLSLMISLTNLGRQPQALEILEQQIGEEFPEENQEGSDTINPYFLLGVILLLIM